ncbi:MAG: hypothetical protein U5K27_05915 [Desulfotignum sp.]|nr:hypothetical protein [Desulfotignum sp.]
MKKIICICIFSVSFLLVSGLCQATTTILTSASPDHTVISGNEETIFGTSASNQITLESGAKAELINFPGQNTIQIQAGSDLFTVFRSGTVVTFEGTDGTLLKIPATTSVQTVEFSDRGPLTLSIHGGQVMLDDQVVTTTPASIENDLGEPLISCGAFVTPSVWKEFDCYNLAAIGKDLGHDPFTPSWSLIGGYWQWGRKGPDPSQWYNTNTQHFAHGPTGPGASEANSGIYQRMGQRCCTRRLPGLDTIKTPNDPCPEGFRVPTITQWEGVLDNNTPNTVGTWSISSTNYSSARFFGSGLMLPAAGFRITAAVRCAYRGYNGCYWSSSESTAATTPGTCTSAAGTPGTSDYSARLDGFSVRCISE